MPGVLMERSALFACQSARWLLVLALLGSSLAYAEEQKAESSGPDKKNTAAPDPKAAPRGNPPKAAEQPRKPQPQGPLKLNIQVQPGRAVVVPRPGNPTAEPLEDAVIFARDRESEQLLKKAAAFLEEKRYSEAARALGAIIEAPEDFFFQPQDESSLHRSVRAEAERLLGSMPAEGRQAYELQFGSRAEELLKQALRDRDWSKLMEVARRFFHTDAGYRATHLLAQYHFDQQRPLAAGLCYQRLQSVPHAARRLEPYLSLELATAWLRAGLTEKVAETLARLKSTVGGDSITIEGKPANWFRHDSQAVAWLEEHLGPQSKAIVSSRDDWNMYRGDPARNAATVGRAPLLDDEGDCWSIPTADDPMVDKLVDNLRQTYQDANFSALPAFQPLTVDNVVLMRTVSTLLAVDFTTGKRLWNIPVDENWGEFADLHGAISQQGNQAQIVSLLDQRLWDDATYGTLSSDGRYVFSIEDLNFTLAGTAQQPRMVVLPNGRRLPTPAWPRNFNRLAAHDIHTGKLVWELGGPRGEYELPMAGAFFLGPPLPLADVVYAIAELNGEIRVTAIDARTGQVQWGQQLAVVELDVLQDPSRRYSGVSPSYADGVLVCPTGSGAIVGLDLSTRSLLWGYRYQNTTTAQPTVIGRRIGAMAAFAGRPREETDHWMDSAATISSGRVLLTPIESQEIHCLSLLDGTPLWKKPRKDNLFLAAVHDGHVILVGRRGMQALKLEDGSAAWPAPLEFASGALPSGRGFLSGDRYFLPLSNAEVATIDLTTGIVTEHARSRKARVPGNLICYRGMILSQTAHRLETFYELDTLKQQVATALDANPNDPQALTQRGALALHRGDTNAAIDDLRKAFELNPDDRTRDLLVDALFEGLTLDFPRYAELGKKLKELISTPEEKSRFIRLMAQGLEKQGDYRGAFELYSQLADASLGALDVERLEDSRRARRDRWAQAGLASVYNVLSGDQRLEIDRQIGVMADEAAKDENPERLRHFIRFFGFHPAAFAARDALARRLAAAGEWLPAEMLWRQVVRGPDAEISRQATVRLALAMKNASRAEAAAYYAGRLSTHFADVVCLDGKTGRQWANEIAADPPIQPDAAREETWPTGRVIKERDERQSQAVRYFPAEFSGAAEIYPNVLTVEMSQDRQTIVGRDGNGVERWKSAVGDPSMRHNLNPSVLQARAIGNLVVVSLGGHVMAIDTMAPGAAGMTRILWDKEIGDSVPGLTNQVGVHVRQIALPWGQHRNLVSDGFGRPVSTLGELGDSYCCLQRGRELSAVDPYTGDTLWTRTDIEPASEVFGDDELLFVVSPNASQAVVLSALDGSQRGHRNVPPFTGRVATLGRRMVTWQSHAGKSVFSMIDAWDQKTIWRHEFPAESKAYEVDQQLLGVVDPAGRFVVVHLDDGRLLVDSPIDPEPSLQEIYLLTMRDRLLLFTNHPWSNNQDGVSVQAVPGLPNNPLLTGNAYGFDRTGGKLIWKTKIDKQGLTLDQPRELPVLVFASRIYERQAGQGGANSEPYTSVLCLDKRNGHVAYQERLKGHIGMFEVTAEPQEHVVTLKLLRHSIRMKFTNDPPQPNDAASPEEQAAGSSRDGDKQQPTDAKSEQTEKAELPMPAPDEQGCLQPAGCRIRLVMRSAQMTFFHREERLG